MRVANKLISEFVLLKEAFGIHNYWISPDGYSYQLEGNQTHSKFISDNPIAFNHVNPGVGVSTPDEVYEQGWIRISSTTYGNVGVTLDAKELNPKSHRRLLKLLSVIEPTYINLELRPNKYSENYTLNQFLKIYKKGIVKIVKVSDVQRFR